MVSVVADKLDRLRGLCEQHQVKAMWLFGSSVHGGASASSDIDALVEFQEMDFRQRADRYYDLRAAMAELFGRSVDLIENEAIENPYFRREVDRSKVQVYAA